MGWILNNLGKSELRRDGNNVPIAMEHWAVFDRFPRQIDPPNFPSRSDGIQRIPHQKTFIKSFGKEKLLQVFRNKTRRSLPPTLGRHVNFFGVSIKDGQIPRCSDTCLQAYRPLGTNL